jgi:ribonuclease HI
MNKKHLNVYTDGSYYRDSKRSGWSWMSEDGLSFASGGLECANISIAELTAAIEAIKALYGKTCTSMTIYTDSTYVFKGAIEGCKAWSKNGWKNFLGEEIKNKELWMTLNQLMSGKNINFQWVRAHSVNPINHKVDKLAKQAANA